MFGLDDLDVNEIDQLVQSDKFMMIFDEDESSGSQHYTSKPKEKKKKKKLAVSRKEFLSLHSKVEQILAAVTIPQPQQSNNGGLQSLAERVERLEERELLSAERISLMVEMGIRALDNNRTTDHKQFLSTAKNLIKEVTTLKNEIQSTLENQATTSNNHQWPEMHNASESALLVLQTTINGLS